jgi:hypothetical protein
MGLFKIQVCVQVHSIQKGKIQVWGSLKFRFVFRYTAYKREKSGMGLFKIQVYVQVHIIQGGGWGGEIVLFPPSVIILRNEISPRSNALIQLT